jgi:hypothetical protein
MSFFDLKNLARKLMRRPTAPPTKDLRAVDTPTGIDPGKALKEAPVPKPDRFDHGGRRGSSLFPALEVATMGAVLGSASLNIYGFARREAHKPEQAKDGAEQKGPAETPIDGYPEQKTDSWVKVRSDKPLSSDELGKVVKRVESAWKFGLQQQGLPEKQYPKTLPIVLLSAAEADKVLGKEIGGGFTSKALLLRREPLLEDGKARGFLLRELVQANDRSSAVTPKNVPLYLTQGRASVIGTRYDEQEKSVGGREARAAGRLAQLSSDEAQQLLRDTGLGAPEGAVTPTVGQEVGALFVEHLRLHGPPAGLGEQTLPKLARVAQAAGKGERFEHAFEQQLGVSHLKAEEAFLAFLKKTEGKPEERFAGTLFEPPWKSAAGKA